MNEFDRVRLLAELTETHCELNHGPDTNSKDYKAVNYIVMPFGYTEKEIEDISVRELVIPVCQECLDAMQQQEWTLLYCFECCRSQWVLRKLAKNRYRHHVLWLRGCPNCCKEFGGLYFNDQQNMFGMNEMKLAI